MSETQRDGALDRPMRPIGAMLTPLMARLDQARQRAEARRAAGQPLCDHCRDTGTRRDARPCSCPAGQRLAEAAAHEAYWRDRIPATFWGATLERSPHGAVAERLRRWIDDQPWLTGGGTVLLMGPVGTGKTALAVGAVRRAYERFDTVPHCYGVADLLDSERPGGDRLPIFARARVASLVVLDDLGAERLTEWGAERLYVLIDARWRAGLATIATTNCTVAELGDRLGERTMSRLLGRSEVIGVAGQDLRRQGWA